MTNTNGRDHLNSIEQLVESNARAIEALTNGMQDFRQSQEQLVRRFDNLLAEMSQERATAYQRITLLENNQSRLIDIMREINRKVNQREEQQ